jgi:integrase
MFGHLQLARQNLDPFPSASSHNASGMHAAAGLLDVDFRQPSIDYKNLLKLVRWITRHAGGQGEMFRRMAFNVLAHNRDDHLKNHAFLMGSDVLQRWLGHAQLSATAIYEDAVGKEEQHIASRMWG